MLMPAFFILPLLGCAALTGLAYASNSPSLEGTRFHEPSPAFRLLGIALSSAMTITLIGLVMVTVLAQIWSTR